jgi:hypothetical protein
MKKWLTDDEDCLNDVDLWGSNLKAYHFPELALWLKQGGSLKKQVKKGAVKEASTLKSTARASTKKSNAPAKKAPARKASTSKAGNSKAK